MTHAYVFVRQIKHYSILYFFLFYSILFYFVLFYSNLNHEDTLILGFVLHLAI